MDNYNQYSTTSYGAQGGAAGGGFMNHGTQGGSQDSPGGSSSKKFGKDSLRPVTIKQVLEAQLPHPDAEGVVDGTEITQVTFIGQIRNISTQTTNITYKMDDGTGTIEVKQWIDSDAISSMDTSEEAKPKLVENSYARVFGKMKEFNNKRHVGAHIVRPITDFNEIQYHLLEATLVHLFFTRGPPNQLSKSAVDGTNQAGYVQQGAYDGAGETAADARTYPQISGSANKVFQALKSFPQNNEGLHVQNLASQLGMQIPEVMKAADELISNGMIYTTVDDNTWAILAF
ncbi:MAG: hypothetical protein M1819_005963 [Sarea resinae]|nr:MAG: hypothetical protein M1819_005963 [Sarea resinae]